MKKTYNVPEIHCHSCAGLIKDTLVDVEGVTGVEVDVPQKAVTVDYANDDLELRVVGLLKEEGYTATAV